jgi:rhamnogalacturonan endolyase
MGYLVSARTSKTSVIVSANEVGLLYRYDQSSSCIVRSAVICYNLANKWTFPVSYLSATQANTLVLSLPYNATDYESAILPRSVYVQYDALRLEVN